MKLFMLKGFGFMLININLNVDTEMLEQIAYDGCMYEVQDILGLKEIHGKLLLHLQIRWRGLQDSDVTWEPLSRLYHDVPKLCKKYVVSKDHKLFHKWNETMKILSKDEK